MILAMQNSLQQLITEVDERCDQLEEYLVEQRDAASLDDKDAD